MKSSTLFLVLLLLKAQTAAGVGAFRRVGTYFVCSATSCNAFNQLGAFHVAASPDGKTLFYTGNVAQVRFVDITDPTKPSPLGTAPINLVGGTGVVRATGLAVVKGVGVAAIDTSLDLFNPSGELTLFTLTSPQTIIGGYLLNGRPASVKASADGNRVVVALDNQDSPNAPAGFVRLFNSTLVSFDALLWFYLARINVTGLTGLDAPSLPRPVDAVVNSNNIAVAALSKNNAFVTFSATTGRIISSFSADTATVTQVDILDTDNIVYQNNVIRQNGNLVNAKRMPVAVTWIDTVYFASVDPGSRGFSIFDSRTGIVVYTPGNELEWLAVKVGHYDDRTSEFSGNTPKNILYAQFGGKKLLFVVSQFASLIFVYDVADVTAPKLEQMLALSTPHPESIVAIPSRNLLVVASSYDNRFIGLRSSLCIFQYSNTSLSEYPSLESNGISALNQGPYIPFASLSGLAATPRLPRNPVTNFLTVNDDAFNVNRILNIAVRDDGAAPYRITAALPIKDLAFNLVSALTPYPNVQAIVNVNNGNTINIDAEGIAISRNSSIVWVVSQSSVSILDVKTPNLLLKVRLGDGNILQAVTWPPPNSAISFLDGFVGVAEYGNYVVVAFRRALADETRARLGLFNYVTLVWKFVFYPLDASTSQNDFNSRVELGDIAPLGNGRFLVLECDNQGGPDASIKRLYEINLGADLDLVLDSGVVTKTLKLDMMPKLATTWGSIPRLLKGLTVDSNGTVWVVNDNIDEELRFASGEQQLNNMGQLYPPAPTAPMASPPMTTDLPPVTGPVAGPMAGPVTAPVAPPMAGPVTSPMAGPVATGSPGAPVASPSATGPAAPSPMAGPVAAPLAPVAAPVASPTGTRKKCGLFRLSIFCPITRCGLLGRLVGLCTTD